MKKGRSTPDLAEIAEFYGLSPAELAELSPAELAELDPAKLAEFSPSERKALKRFEELENFIALISGPSKKLSDYAKHIMPKAQAYFDKEKKEQLAAALSTTTRWRQIPYRVDDLAEIIVLLAPTLPHSDPPTEAQIYFWAMLEAYRDYMKTGKQHSDREVSRQLTLDMAFAFCRLLAEGMNIAAKYKTKLLKRIDALSIIARDRLNEDYPSHQQKAITQERAAEIITRIFDSRNLRGVTASTVSRWVNGKATPKWFSAGLLDLEEDAFAYYVRRAAAAEQNKRQMRNPVSYDENDAPTVVDPADRMDEEERAKLLRQIEALDTEEIAELLQNRPSSSPRS